MKIIKLYKLTKIVEYFGLILEVPVNSKYIATDVSGGIYAYKVCPMRDELEWTSIGGYMEYDTLALVDLQEIDWKQTLQEI